MNDINTITAQSSRSTNIRPAEASGTFLVGGGVPVHRLGFGAMQLTGDGIWGEPEDRDEAIAVLRRALDLGINLIDTADSYGPEVSERLIAEALHPYPENLLIATKAGFQRPGPNRWVEDGRPEHLRSAVDGSLRRLKLEQIDLLQLHRIDLKVPMEDQIGALVDLQRQGKIRYIGLSEVSVKQIEAVRRITPIVSVQNRYNLVDQKFRGRAGILHAGKSWIHPLVSTRHRRARETERPTHARSQAPQRAARADRARLAAREIDGNATDSRNFEGQPP